ncbi:MAG: ergothioneine biosynthesis protein EgtB [Gammaproteobacteria bacterium]|jgi:ergothioneine biosynthesis protein EgtB
MASPSELAPARRTTAELLQAFTRVRHTTGRLCATLEPEDCVIQTMADVSPAKWHLAHTTWFFENFLLVPRLAGYKVFHPGFGYLFNSYYYTVGRMHPRPQRGLLSRPTVAEVSDYRAHVNEHMHRLIEQQGEDGDLQFLVALGMNHEQQHQELLLTDIKHVFSVNPLVPAFHDRDPPRGEALAPLKWLAGHEGIVEIGYRGGQFCFDNETPRHRTLLHPHAIADRLVTNAEFLEFIRDDGYRTPEFWLSDGWATVQNQGWERPLYWSDDLAHEFTLAGERALDPHAPVCHVSYYEADAFARWKGCRLPTEAEWETAAADCQVTGNFQETGVYHPLPLSAQAERDGSGDNAAQLFGDVWEWTSSPYVNYPGYRPPTGSIGEYNGKFMCNQMVLRGGSCATPLEHIRASYRNFFYPHSRWQFTGIRLARDS